MDKQDKPLRDWTLGEAHEECSKHDDCDECPFYGNACCVGNGTIPAGWDLTDQPRFTEDEVACMRVLYAAGVVRMCKFDDGWIRWDGKDFGGSLPPLMFPSIRPGQTLELAELLEGRDGKEADQ